MRRRIALSIIAATLTVLTGLAALTVLPAAPAFADSFSSGPPCMPPSNGNGAVACTVHADDVPLLFFAGPCVQFLGGAALVGNAVFHVTQNAAGDFWITTTNEGTFVRLPAGFTEGRATQWFGDENNNMNQVVHAISDGQVTDASGATIRFHETLHFSVSANGQQSPVVFDNCTVS